MNRLVVPALVGLALGSILATRAAVSAPPPTQCGFLDVNKAMDTYRKPKDVYDQLRAKNETRMAGLKKRAAALDQLADKLNTMSTGTREYAELDRQITLEKYAIELDDKLGRRELDDEKKKKLAGIYKELCQAAEGFMAQRGLAKIELYIPPDTDFGDNLSLYMTTRTVLCRDPSLDVTADIVTLLNAQLPPPAVVAPNPAPANSNPATQPEPTKPK
jgi:Skp family chaperone for outer membrane proteins